MKKHLMNKLILAFIVLFLIVIGITDTAYAEGETSAVVTQDTFGNYFADDGTLLQSVDVDTLTFQGDFNGNDLKNYIVLDRAITINSDKAVLKDMGFIIDAENVTLDGLKLNATSLSGNLILVRKSNVTIKNMDISYTVGDVSANVINICSTATLSNISVVDNTIAFDSLVQNDEDLVTAINIENVKNSVIDKNSIDVSLPALYVQTYDFDYFLMGLCYVSPIRFYKADTVEFTNNTVDVKRKNYYMECSFPTTQAVSIVASKDIQFKKNGIYLEDIYSGVGAPIYAYGVLCGFSSVTFEENEISVDTIAGKPGSGCVYGLYLAVTDALVNKNIIQCSSVGPAIGINSPYGFGQAKELLITDNIIEASGYVSDSSSYSLVNGIEIENGYATINKNTISVTNTNEEYNDSFPVAGIGSIIDSATTLAFTIESNIIYTNGKYTVDIRYPVMETYVVGNQLNAHELTGRDSVFIQSGSKNVSIASNNLQLISKQPSSIELTYGYTENNTLTVVAGKTSTAAYDEIKYQWYKCDDNTGTNPSLIEGATLESYDIPLGMNAGEEGYYYCELTATKTNGSAGKKESSDIVSVVVLASEEPTATPTKEPDVTPSPTSEPTPTKVPDSTPSPTSEPTPIKKPTSEPTATVTPVSQPTARVTPTTVPSPAVTKDKVTTFSIKNKATVKKSAKIKIKDKDKIKKITLNGKAVKIKKNKTSFTLKLKSYKKKLKKKGKWNTLKVTDNKGNTKTIKFKTK